MVDARPSQQMRALGVFQHGAGILAEPARAFDLPAERDEAEHVGGPARCLSRLVAGVSVAGVVLGEGESERFVPLVGGPDLFGAGHPGDVVVLYPGEVPDQPGKDLARVNRRRFPARTHCAAAILSVP
ncbi:hypothetical protein [Streptomyces sp. NPDC093707]|uniref:hypothetical protein n=1 Tax=Streptomyces sp. NPDC093707 TaxID=3154984 RepID=UPI00344B222F